MAGFLGLTLVCVSGCVSVKSQDEIEVEKSRPAARQGVYHKVKRSETLWRIAKTYGMTVDSIAQANNIPKAAKIEDGQLVFIPGATAVQEIILESDEESNEFIWPVKGKIIRYFHERYGGQVNKGIDIKAKVGEDVKAARTGRVVFADRLSGYGQTIILDHQDGLYSVYAMNSKLLVKLDEQVLKDKVIAKVGHSHNLAYLHFQIRKKSVEDNPLYYLP